jgi:hypothetical protein
MTRIVTFLIISISAYSPGLAEVLPSLDTDRGSLQALLDHDRRPLSFTENRGQWDEVALFRAETGGTSFFFGQSEVSYLFVRNAEPKDSWLAEKGEISGRSERTLHEKEALLIKASFVGANPGVEVRGEGRLPHNNNYFLGNDPELWRTDVPNYSSVVYRDLWPGIDLRYHGNGKGMKYDFIVNPGAEVSQIRVRYEGVNNLSITTQGALEARTAFGQVYENVPLIYQEVDGGARRINGHYKIYEGETFGFELEGGYNPGQTLVIDPELVYSTYLGGAGGDQGRAIAVDDNGNAYITGITASTNFPTQNPYQIEPGDFNTDVFVSKISQSGDSLIYSTYLGGNSADLGYGIAVDGSGSAFLVGETSSNNFPTQNPYQNDQRIGDAFVTKLSPLGNSLIYGTYLGGFGTDEAFCIFVDSEGNAYVAGATTSDDFPIQNPYQTDQIGKDCFISKLSPSGDSLIYGTYLGGDSDDIVNGIAVDVFGNAYVAGNTSSTDFPVQNPYQDSLGDLWSDAFVSKLSPPGDSLIYSTYLGGDGADYGNGIAVGDDGSAYVTGGTWSTNFPTENPYQTDPDFVGDVFVTKFSSSGDSLVYSTYLGGASSEEGYGVVVDRQGNACVTGLTASANFPVVDPYQTDQTFNDAFVTKLSPSGDALIYSTYLGGGDDDFGYGIAVDSLGEVYVAGQTYSTDFPTLNPYQTNQGSTDVFVSKFGPEIGPPPVGSISGIVTDSSTGIPLAGAIVRAFLDSIVVNSDTTDAGGGYFLADLQIAPHNIEASRVDYATQINENILVVANETTVVNFALVREGPPPCSYVPGDINGNGSANGIDVTYGVAYLKGGPVPPIDCGAPVGPCPHASPFYAAADVNGNCAFNGIDITFYVSYLKGSQPALLFCIDCPPAGAAAREHTTTQIKVRD